STAAAALRPGFQNAHARSRAGAGQRPRLRVPSPRSGPRSCRGWSWSRQRRQKSRSARSGAARGQTMCSLRRGQPAAGKTGALQTAPQMRAFLHDPPDQVAAIVLDHRANRPLIDADIVAVDPAEAGDGATMVHRTGWIEAQVERIEKAVGRVDEAAV